MHPRPGTVAREADVYRVSIHFSYMKMMFSSRARASTITARIPGRWYQGKSATCGRAVSEYTNPVSLPGSGARVARLTRMVTTKQAVQAKMAVQKFCAISLG